jgi:hypothetical protein
VSGVAVEIVGYSPLVLSLPKHANLFFSILGLCVGVRMQDHLALHEYLGQFVTAEAAAQALIQERLSQGTAFPVSDGRTIGAVVLLPHAARPSRRETAPQPWSATYTFTDLIGNSASFRECIDFARTVSQQAWLERSCSGTRRERLPARSRAGRRERFSLLSMAPF